MLKKLFYIFTSCLILQVPTVFSQMETGNLAIRVFTSEGDSLMHYKINIQSHTSIQTHNVSTCAFRIKELMPDFYTIHIEKKGFHSFEMTRVPIKENSVTVIDFKLRKKKCRQKRQTDTAEYKEHEIVR